MPDYKPLSDRQIKEISGDYFKARENKAAALEEPTMLLIGAQPGAGKSNVASIAKAELSQKGGYIHVDADRMREQIYLGGTKPTSQETQADAGKLANAVRDVATENKRNILEEGTFRNSEAAAKFIEDRKEKGYNVELIAVATPREESILGIYQRHELQHQAGSNNPRFVPIEYHDEALKGFDRTLATQAGSLDRVRVVERSGNVLFDSQAAQNRHANPMEALHAGRQISDAKLYQLGNSWAKVNAAAEARGAGAEYLQGIQGHALRIEDAKKERIHVNAMAKLQDNVKTLQGDGRYSAHDSKELLKAAYFRGFHEKSAEFHGKPADFNKYDNAMASRSQVSNLPDVAELEGMRLDRAQSVSQDKKWPDLSL